MLENAGFVAFCFLLILFYSFKSETFILVKCSGYSIDNQSVPSIVDTKNIIDVSFFQDEKLFTSLYSSLYYFHGEGKQLDKVRKEDSIPLPFLITHVIFDCDGILIGSDQVYEHVLKTLLNERFKVKPVYESTFYWEHLVGASDNIFAEKIFKQFPSLLAHFPSSETCQQNFLDLFDEQMSKLESSSMSLFKPTKGIFKMLEMLSKNGITLNIATNSLRNDFNSKLIMNKQNTDLSVKMMKYFDAKATVCVDDVSKGKPDPEIYWKAAENIGIKDKTLYSKCLVFEDSWTGVQAALSAGMRVIWMVDKNRLGNVVKILTSDPMIEKLQKDYLGSLFIHPSEQFFEDLVLENVFKFIPAHET